MVYRPMDLLCRFLAWKYGRRALLHRTSVSFPVTCYPAPASQWSRLDTLPGTYDPTPPPPVSLDPQFNPTGLFNGPVFALRHLRPRPELRLDLSLTGYFCSMNTHEALELELLAHRPALRAATPAAFLEFDRRLVRRATVSAPAALGVATLVVCENTLLLARLAAKSLPHRAGQWHVVPAGMFAPPYSLTQTVAQELHEELGLPLDTTRLYCTGLAINLLNLRPEVCTLLLLDSSAGARLSAEFQPGLTRVPLASDRKIVQSLGLDAGNITPTGAAALFLGLRLLRRLQTLKRDAKLS